MDLQLIEPTFPRRNMRVEPIVRYSKCPRSEGACAYAPGFFRRDKAAPFEHVEVLQQRRKPDLKRFRKLADRGIPLAQVRNDRTARWIGQSSESQAQPGLKVFHMAN